MKSKQKKFCSRHCQAVGYRLEWSEEKKSEASRNISKAAKERCAKPEWLKKQSISQKKVYANPELRRLQSELGKKRFEDPVFKDKIVSNLNGKMKDICKTKEYREKLSKKALEMGQKPEIKEMRKRNSIKNWQNPEYAKKVMRRRDMSGPEKTFLEQYIVANDLPYDFTGNVENKSIIIGGKVPDFTHRTEPKVIEIYGDFFHKGQNPQDRIDYLKQYGYDCLVIWASELKDTEKILEKINSFLEE